MIPTGEARTIIKFWILSCEDFQISNPDFKCPIKGICEHHQKQMFNRIITECK